MPADALRALVERRITDPGVVKSVTAVLDAYAEIAVQPNDRVLIHGDLMAENIAIDETAGQFVGMFDFADAQIGDRHLDLKYIHSFGRSFAERLMSAYEAAAGVVLDRRRPGIYHIAAAVSHLTIGDPDSEPPQRNRVKRWVREILAEAF